MGSPRIQRKTRQLEVILEVLRKLTSHPTADQLYRLVRRRLPRISLGTVYRNLERLTQSDMIRAVYVSGSPTRFDGNMEPHYHVRCNSCGRIDDVYDVPIDPEKDNIRHLNGFKIHGHRLEFVGTCPECRS